MASLAGLVFVKRIGVAGTARFLNSATLEIHWEGQWNSLPWRGGIAKSYIASGWGKSGGPLGLLGKEMSLQAVSFGPNLTCCSQRSYDERFDPEVTVVMPCLNESETLATCVQESMSAFRDYGICGEVVIADNGSTDRSQAIAISCGARVVDVAAKGYGSALMGGIAAASGEFIVMGDADGSYDFGDIPKFIAKLEEGYDLVVGTRFLGGIMPGAMPWHHRYIGNPVLSGIGRLLFRSPVRDFHCGLRAFRQDAIQRLNLTCTGMEFASEMVIKATLHRLRITEIPTTLRPDGRSRRPHLRSFRDGWRHLKLMLMLSPRWLFVIPGISLLLPGFIAMTVIGIRGSLTIAGTQFGVSTSFAAAMTALVGVQLTVMGVVARQYVTAIGTHPPQPILQRVAKTLSAEHGTVFGFFFWSWERFGSALG